MIRIGAVGDLHFGADSAGTLRPQLESIGDRVDVFLVAGDLTKCGTREEAEIFAREIGGLPVPCYAVLGNHDYESNESLRVRGAMEGAGVRVLECESDVVSLNGVSVGIAGAKGFGGGFAGAYATPFGEPEMKAFVRYTSDIASGLEGALHGLDADIRLLLLHYAPVRETLEGERPELYPFLGSYLFGEVADRAGVDLILHGHAHAGTEKGVTSQGIQVRNVAQPVIRHAYNVYHLNEGRERVGAERAGTAV